MKKLLIPASVPALAVAAALAFPAQAQDEDTKLNQIFIAEGEECPQSTADTIVVCGRLEDPYRIPKELRQSESRAAEPWTERVRTFEMVGDFGTLSCSPSGAGGFTGCTQEMIRQAYGEKAASDSVRFAQLIADQREERLSTIDEEAADTQARVEELEAAYMRKLEEERRAKDPDATPLPAPEAQTAPGSAEADDPEG